MRRKEQKSRKKIASAAAMLLLSSAMLGTATYAWFTMNKTVEVTGMQMKAHAEEGLLINEVKTWNDGHWDESAIAGDTEFTALRPASTKNLADWWHANSKKSSSEAGASGATGTTVDTDTVGLSYTSISPGAVSVETTNTNGVGGSYAEKSVYYTNATFGTSGAAGTTYDNGEGFYVKYTYYLKSSKNDAALTVSRNNLLAAVTATKKNTETSGTSDNLDKSLRVGIQVGSNTSNFNIFAPVSGATASYSVAGSTSGTTYETVTPATTEAAINPAAAVDIPKATSDGIPVYIYVWFEGEDQNCKSDNLTDVLNSYQIDVKFTDNDL